MFSIIIYLWLLTILLIAAVLDIYTRKIPNQIIFIGLIGVLSLQFYSDSFQWPSFLIGLGLGLLLWRFRVVGGGDSKLIILVSAVFPLNYLIQIYAFIALAGALQALWWMAFKKPSNLPYAVAILLGTTGFVWLQKKTSWWEVFF
ncbi:prepilin peptidase [bacterium]|nr:prepilin peptidase [bacterium]NCQ54954.1 prepilin peptidase [Candidatus Parcubacteria bacterium]NCS66998.1 prepilin peptidase [Candidatus Peregrinibacteria bacterium]NCS95944.1 prepilin peptidase [bacterium]